MHIPAMLDGGGGFHIGGVYIYPTRMRKGVIGCVVVVVSTKIPISRDIGV